MKPRQTAVLAVCLLVLSVGLGGFFWRHITHTRSDSDVADQMQSYTCSHCNKSFEISVGEAAAMRRSSGDVLCPYCNQGDTRKDNVVIDMGGQREAEPATEEEDSEEVGREDRPRPRPVPAAGRTPKAGR